MMKRKKENRDLKSLDKFVNEQYGKRGTEEREIFEKGFDRFKSDLPYSSSKVRDNNLKKNN